MALTVIYLYVHVFVGYVINHFSEERVKFLTCKVMVVMRMLICPHCTHQSERKLKCKGKA